MTKPVLIAANIGLPDSVLGQLLQHTGKAVEWAALSPDYARVAELEALFGDRASKLDIAGLMQTAARDIRPDFLRLTAELGKKYASQAWWASSVSERNTMTSGLFQNCCYAEVARRLKNREGNLLILCESPALLGIIRDMYSPDWQVTARDMPFWKKFYKTGGLRPVASLFYNMMQGWKRKLICGRNPAPPDGNQRTDMLLHTWVDEKSFTDGEFINDRYYTLLPAWLRARDLKVKTLVTMAPMERSYREALSFFRKNSRHYIVPDDVYTYADYLYPAALFISALRFRYRKLEINGIDVSPLFREEKRSAPIGFGVMQYRLMKRLADKNLRPTVLVDLFENMIQDKLMILGVKRFLPGTKIYGFFHIPAAPMLLCSFIHPSEATIAPLPDKIICNGRVYRDRLIESGYPEDRVVVGAALRYAYLYKQKHAPAGGGNTEHADTASLRLLVPLPITEGTALELILKVLEAARGASWTIYLKPHPMSLDFVNGLPEKIRSRVDVLTGTMEEAMALADAVVTGASSAALDAALSGMPLFRVARESAIDLDPLDGMEGFEKTCLNAADLRKAIQSLETARKNGDDLIHYDPARLLNDLFAPATDENLAVFLPDGLTDQKQEFAS